MRKTLSASTYAEATINIPFERLAKMLQPGDTVFAWGRFKCSGEKYIVTAVNWWGVWAIPDPDFIARLGYTKVDTKSHEKLKWCNILGVDFCAEEQTFSVQIRTGRHDILHNPAVRKKYPELYAGVKAQGEFPCDYLYALKFNAWRQYKRYLRNKSIGCFKGVKNMYRVPITYSCFMGFHSINEDMRSFGLMEEGQNIGFRQTITITMPATEIPSPEMVKEYGRVLKDEYNKTDGKFDIVSIEFESFGAIEKLEDPGNEK